MTRRSSRSVRSMLVVATAMAALACAPRPVRAPPPAEKADPAIPERLRALDAALDQLEARLLSGQATVSLWDELRNRHERVAAVTCSNLSEHANAIAAFMTKERDQGLRRSKNRLASRTVAPATALR